MTNTADCMYQATVNDRKFTVETEDISATKGQIDGQAFGLDVLKMQAGMWHVIRDNRSYTVISEGFDDENRVWKLTINGKPVQVGVKNKMELLMEQLGLNTSAGKKVNDLKAPMPGLVLRSVAQEGDTVKKGDTLLVLEAMKMENTIKSPGEGTVQKIMVQPGQAVEKGQVLITFR